MENPKNLNRLKAVLADAGQTNKWLAEQLGFADVGEDIKTA